jgi:hypothetical protein
VAQGGYETPYAFNVWRPSGEVWMAANNSDRVLRFSPATKTFLSYPSPTRVTFLRDFSFTNVASPASPCFGCWSDTLDNLLFIRSVLLIGELQLGPGKKEA